MKQLLIWLIQKNMEHIMADQQQIDRLHAMLLQNKTLQVLLDRAGELGMSNWYVGAGCISQTVWNSLHGFDPEHAIKDYDLVYYDGGDISYEAEDKIIQQAKDVFKDIGVHIDIINEARVHLWIEQKLGYSIDQYKNVEEAISTWPTTITCVGINRMHGVTKVFAPFGLDDVFNMVIRPNKYFSKKEIYDSKVEKWTKIWPKLTVVKWDDEQRGEEPKKYSV